MSDDAHAASMTTRTRRAATKAPAPGQDDAGDATDGAPMNDSQTAPTIDPALIERLRQAITSQTIVARPIASLKAYERNARLHGEAQIEQLKASIIEFGWTNPVLIDEDGTLIAGHGRVEAASRLGLDMVPTVTLAGLSDEQRRAYVIADNQHTLNAVWDVALRADELRSITGIDPAALGFTSGMLQEILIGGWEHGLAAIEKTPPNANPTTGVVTIECRVLDAAAIAEGIKEWLAARPEFDEVTVRVS